MIKAGKQHKERAIEILAACFDTNKTVNWIVKQDLKREERIKNLIDYSFEACIRSGEVYMPDDESGVIICSLSENKMPILEEAYLTMQFVWKVTGIKGLKRAMWREDYIKQFHPQDKEFMYIWFIGIKKNHQGKGIGSAMLHELINNSDRENLPIYLETSVLANLHFYQKHGFEVYHETGEEVFGFKLYFLRRLSRAAK